LTGRQPRLTCPVSRYEPIKAVGTEKRREKVVVLRELHRAIIYTRELSKQAIEDHVSTAFTVYSVNEGARLTQDTVCREKRPNNPFQLFLVDYCIVKFLGFLLQCLLS
jgi:hypothetical protein